MFHSSGKVTSHSSAANTGADPSTWSLDRLLQKVNKVRTGQRGEEPALAQAGSDISVQLLHICACSFSTSTVYTAFTQNPKREGPPLGGTCILKISLCNAHLIHEEQHLIFQRLVYSPGL